MASNSTSDTDLSKDRKSDQNQTVIKPLGWAIPMYSNDVKSSNQGTTVQQVPLTHEPSAIDNNPLVTNTQPVALLVPSVENGGSNPVLPKQITVPPNCYLVMDRNGSTQQPMSQNYIGDGSKIHRNSRMGLECLDGVEKIWIHQKVELFEILSNWETANQYIVKGPDGGQLFTVSEESDICSRQFCGRLRSFALHVFNPVGDKLVTIRRDFKCGAVLASCHLCCCCFWHCGRADCGKGCENFVSNFMQEIFLEAPDSEILGKVKQEPTCAVPKWTILDPNDNILLRIVGPPSCYLVCFPCISFADRLQFKIQSADSQAELGIIRKEWAGFMREMFTDADDFSVAFPPDLDSKVKALVIGAVFLLDFTYFENNHKQSS